MYTTLISPEKLRENLNQFIVFDCRFVLGSPDAGEDAYQASHIPGAIYAHLDRDLCGPIVPGKTGRHPLPGADVFIQKLIGWGVCNESQVVVYDDQAGAYAARLWWMLKWVGHPAVAVLDGGWQSWLGGEKLISADIPTPIPGHFTAQIQPELLATTEDILTLPHTPKAILLDSRLNVRYNGEIEPIDPVAGHIPWAINAPHTNVVGADGKFLSAITLKKYFTELIGNHEPAQAVFYCGSGVTAAQNLVAMAHAGLGLGRLYGGSWSEWILDPQRPVASITKNQ